MVILNNIFYFDRINAALVSIRNFSQKHCHLTFVRTSITHT